MGDTIISTIHSSTTAFADKCYFDLVGTYTHCFYNLSNPSVYFSLGEAIAAFGLIFAVYQLGANDRSWRMAVRIRPFWQRHSFWFLGCAGLFLIAVSSLISQVPSGTLQPPFGIPLFYEFFAFILFILSPITLFLLFIRKTGLFTNKRAEIFYQVLLAEIARPTTDNLEAAINIIASNLDAIAKAASKRPWIPRRGRDVTLSEEEEFAEYAAAILDVCLSEKKVVDYIVTSRLDFLHHLFVQIKRNRLDRRCISMAVEKIIDGLYENTQSHLYTQYNRRGLALAANVYEFIFADPYIVDEFSVFNNALPWNTRETLTEEALSVILEAFGTATESYWKHPDKWRSVSTLRQGLRELDEYLQGIAYLADRYNKDKNKHLTEQTFNKIRQIESFLTSSLSSYLHPYSDALKANRVPPNELNADETDDWHGSLNAAYAKSLYKFFESMASIDDADDNIYHSLVDIIHSLDNEGKDGIREKFFGRIWKKIAENEKGYFPAVARCYLNVMAIQISPLPTGGWRRDEGRKILDLLERLRPRIIANEIMANKELIERALLPKNIYFDRVMNQFVEILGFGRGPRRIVGTDTQVPDPPST